MKEFIPALVLLVILASPPLVGHLVQRFKRRQTTLRQSKPARPEKHF